MCIRKGKSLLKGHTVHNSTPGCSGKGTAVGTVKGWGGWCQGSGVNRQSAEGSPGSEMTLYDPQSQVHIIHLSKPMAGTTPKLNPHDSRLKFTIMCQYQLMSRSKCIQLRS